MKPQRSPNLAIVLALLVPGLGHAYAGRGGRGLLWLVLVTVPTFSGWALAGPALLTQYRVDLNVAGTRLATPTLLPESANFLETVFAQSWLGVADPDAPPRATAPVGFALTTSAAMVHVVGAADAGLLGRMGALPLAARSPALAAILAWLVPGAGHWYLGRRAKGAIAGAALLATFGLGIAFAHGTLPQRDRDQYFWSGEALLGLPALAATIANAGRRVQEDLPLAELGLLCATVAGLLNSLLMLDAFATAERDLAPPSAEGAEAAA